MEKKESSRKSASKNGITLSKILRRPIVRLLLLIIVIIVLVLIIKNIAGSSSDESGLIGFQRIVSVTDDTYTYIDLDEKTKVYEGYASMEDFYYDVTCVAKVNEDTGVTEMALINKKEKQIVKYGTYEDYTQIIGGKYYKVAKDGKYGVIDYNGNVIISPEYDYISITTVQEATELIFECQSGTTYYFANENGNVFYETTTALHSISYANKFNSDYDTIIYISIDGEKKYFNLETGDQVFEDVTDFTISYNILKTDTAVSFCDESGNVKTEFTITDDVSYDARVYFKEYVVLEQKTTTSTGAKEYLYTVYDSNFKKVLESENKINVVQDIDGNTYFITNEDNAVTITNEKKKAVTIEGYQYNGSTASSLQYLVLNPTDSSTTYDVYTFKGKKAFEDTIVEYTQKGFGLIVQGYGTDGESEKAILLADGAKVTLESDDTVTATDYYLIVENSASAQVSVVDKDGNITVDKVSGTKLFYVEGYIGVQDGSTVNVYDTQTGSQTFTYDVSEYVNRDETINTIELSTGYYTFSGKTIVEK